MDSLNWEDIGYHFLTDKLGYNFEGRAGSMTSYPRGAHDGVNDGSFGFNIMGYYHTPYNQQPTCVSRMSLYDVIAWRMPNNYTPYGESWYGKRSRIAGYLCGHRDVKSTACPGDLMYAYIGANVYAGEARDEVSLRITTGGATDLCTAPTPWTDPFDGTSVDTTAPEPDWTLMASDYFSLSVSSGLLHLHGSAGNANGGIRNSDYEVYQDFSLQTKVTLDNILSTAGGSSESNAEIRFRCQNGTGYSLSFKAGTADQVINLRRSDTWAIIQGKQISHSFANGQTFHVNINCSGSTIDIEVGATQGAADVVDWSFSDSTFASGCFWLFNWQMTECDFDYITVTVPGQ